MSCPNCEKPALGATCVRMHTRGSEVAVDAAICTGCGTVFVPDDEMERYRDRERERIDEVMREDVEQALEAADDRELEGIAER